MVQIGTDFEGFPLEALTVKEILLKLGFKTDGDKFSIDKDAPILNVYPLVFEDDGIAYGVNPRFVTEVDPECVYGQKIKEINYEVGENKKLDISIVVKDSTVKVFNVFTDVPENKVEDEDDE